MPQQERTRSSVEKSLAGGDVAITAWTLSDSGSSSSDEKVNRQPMRSARDTMIPSGPRT